jgi:hypothetical protein
MTRFETAERVRGGAESMVSDAKARAQETSTAFGRGGYLRRYHRGLVRRRLTPRALRGRHRLSVCSMLEPGLSFENL